MINIINENSCNSIFSNVRFLNEKVSTDLKWKYKNELIDDTIFDKVEKDFSVKIPKSLRKFIKEYNASTPEKYHFKAGNTAHVFGSVLSYNKKDPDNIFTVLKGWNNKNKIPFAIDPFGNYICYSSGSIEFWNHETDEYTRVCNSLSDLINSLY